MTKKNVWIVYGVMPVMLAILLFLYALAEYGRERRTSRAGASASQNRQLQLRPANVDGARGNYRDVDEPRRYSSYDRKHGWGIQIEGQGHGRDVLVHVHEGGDVYLFLLGTSEDDGKDHRAVER